MCLLFCRTKIRDCWEAEFGEIQTFQNRLSISVQWACWQKWCFTSFYFTSVFAIGHFTLTISSWATMQNSWMWEDNHLLIQSKLSSFVTVIPFPPFLKWWLCHWIKESKFSKGVIVIMNGRLSICALWMTADQSRMYPLQSPKLSWDKLQHTCNPDDKNWNRKW